MTDAERFDQHVTNTMRQEREAIERRWRSTVVPGTDGRVFRSGVVPAEDNTHDEWRKMNEESDDATEC